MADVKRRTVRLPRGTAMWWRWAQDWHRRDVERRLAQFLCRPEGGAT